MSESTLVDKINLEATVEIEALKKAAQADIALIQHETKRQLESMRAAHNAEKAKTLSHLELVAVSKAKQAGKIALQQAKRKQMDELFATVAADLEQLPPAEYVTFFARHLAVAVPSDIKVDVVHAPAARLEETKQILAAQGLAGTVVADEQVTVGLLLRAVDGVYDVTLHRILDERRPTLEMEVMKTLQT